MGHQDALEQQEASKQTMCKYLVSTQERGF